MRKTIRLLKIISEDIEEGIIKTAELQAKEEKENEEIAEEIGEANAKICKANALIGEALETLEMIYQECYDD